MSDKFGLFLNESSATGGDGETGTGGTSQEDESTNTSQEDNAATQGGSGDKSEMVPKSEAQEARREAQGLRKRLKESEAKAEALEKEKMSDSDKILKERDTLKEKLTATETRTRNLQVQVLANKVGVVDPEAVGALLDWSKITDTEDDREVEEAIRSLVRDKPYLAGTHAGRSDGGAGDGSGGDVSDMNAMLREAAGVRV